MLDIASNEVKPSSDYSLCACVCIDGLTMLWQIIKNRISKLDMVGLLPDLGKVEYPAYELCISGKMIKKIAPKRNRSSKIFNYNTFRHLWTIECPKQNKGRIFHYIH